MVNAQSTPRPLILRIRSLLARSPTSGCCTRICAVACPNPSSATSRRSRLTTDLLPCGTVRGAFRPRLYARRCYYSMYKSRLFETIKKRKRLTPNALSICSYTGARRMRSFASDGISLHRFPIVPVHLCELL